MSLTHSLTRRLAVSAISPLFVVRFDRSILFYYVEFEKEAINNGFIAHSSVLRGGGGGNFKCF